MLPLLEIIGVTSTKMTFSVGFAFLESEKKDIVIWVLEVCKTMLKDQKNMPNIIVTNYDTILMNSVAKVFPTSYALLYRYHITKTVRSIHIPVVGTKQIKGEDGKMVKVGVVLKSIMDTWNGVINSST